MSYQTLAGIHNPATGTVPPVTWGDQINDNFEYLASPPECNLSGTSTNRASSSSTFMPADCGIENFDTDGMHTGSQDKMVVVTAGRYRVDLTVLFDTPVASSGSPAGGRHIGVRTTGSSAGDFGLAGVAADPDETTLVHGSRVFQCSAGDELLPITRQSNPPAAIIADTVVEFSARWEGP